MTDYYIIVEDVPIKYVKQINFLGIVIKSGLQLGFRNHVNYMVAKKISIFVVF